jgi:hypothetical protein
MKTFKNTRFIRRDYEATNVVACQAETPPADWWIECDASKLDGLTRLWTEDGRTYYGWL